MKNEIKWSIDPAHSDISFKVRHLMIAHVKGSFKTFDASIFTTAKDFTTAEIDLWIDSSTITTGDAKRDLHLKSADFFDVEKYKQITFTSSTIGQEGPDGIHELWGELTIKGITRNIKLNVEFGGMLKDPLNIEKAGFTITGKISRKDWGLVWNATMETGGVMVSDEVDISCEIELSAISQKNLSMELNPAAEKTVMV